MNPLYAALMPVVMLVFATTATNAQERSDGGLLLTGTSIPNAHHVVDLRFSLDHASVSTADGNHAPIAFDTTITPRFEGIYLLHSRPFALTATDRVLHLDIALRYDLTMRPPSPDGRRIAPLDSHSTLGVVIVLCKLVDATTGEILLTLHTFKRSIPTTAITTGFSIDEEWRRDIDLPTARLLAGSEGRMVRLQTLLIPEPDPLIKNISVQPPPQARRIGESAVQDLK